MIGLIFIWINVIISYVITFIFYKLGKKSKNFTGFYVIYPDQSSLQLLTQY